MPLAFRSIDSLLAEAKASKDPSLAARCVVAACAQAATSEHWTDILDGMPPALSDATNRARSPAFDDLAFAVDFTFALAAFDPSVVGERATRRWRSPPAARS